MKTKWLLQTDVFEENLHELENVIKSQGMECKIIKYVPFQQAQSLDVYDSKDCVVFYGSLSMAQAVKRQTSWVPGVWCDLPKFECTYYYNYLGEFLLNDRYIMLPYGELLRQKEFLFDTLGNNGCIFVRPSSGFKIFTGNIIREEFYKTEITSLNMVEIDKNRIVIVSEPKNLIEEWRLIVVDKEVIAASQYHEYGEMKIVGGCPATVWDYGNKIAKVWQPEAAFAIDICRTKEDELRLVEINSFSSSGIYDCNKEDVVKAISELALKEYEDIYGN